MYVDLHIHSWFSDGTFSPQEIVKKALANNISLISVCDHNTIDAYGELETICNASGIGLMKGVEINAAMDGEEIHILAYGFDAENSALNNLLKYNRDVYDKSGKKLIKNISKNYHDVCPDEYAEYKRNPKNGGWDSLDYLFTKGIVSDFYSYVKMAQKYGTVENAKFLHPADVIKIIHDAGGQAVLAHIGHIANGTDACVQLAAQFLDMGIDGFECYYPAHSAEFSECIAGFCRKHDLIITAGGDEHGRFAAFGDHSEFYIGAVKYTAEQLCLRGLAQ